jgi:hypothetical protein
MNEVAVLCAKKETQVEELETNLRNAEQKLQEGNWVRQEHVNTYPDSLDPAQMA